MNTSMLNFVLPSGICSVPLNLNRTWHKATSIHPLQEICKAINGSETRLSPRNHEIDEWEYHSFLQQMWPMENKKQKRWWNTQTMLMRKVCLVLSLFIYSFIHSFIHSIHSFIPFIIPSTIHLFMLLIYLLLSYLFT